LPRTSNSFSVTGADQTEAALARRAIAMVEIFMIIRWLLESEGDLLGWLMYEKSVDKLMLFEKAKKRGYILVDRASRDRFSSNVQAYRVAFCR
jgi:hypothetical protein